MATCKGCGASVGCGCQLVDGLCGYCRGKIKKFKNVITQTYRLFRMF